MRKTSLHNHTLSAVSSLAGVAFDTISPERLILETSCNWSDIYREAARQTILGYAFLGLTKLTDISDFPVGIASRWVGDVERIRLCNLRQRKINSEIESLFSRAEIPCLLLKGQRTGALYDKPDLRQCGDIDYYFDSPRNRDRGMECIIDEIESDMPSCLSDICQLGIRPLDRLGFKPDGSYVLFMGDTLIELHPSPPAGIGSVNDGVAHPESILLASSLHILRHASTFGVGLRQLCDLAMECRAFVRREDAGEAIARFETLIRRYNVRRWWSLLETFLITYLMIPPSWLPFKGKIYYTPEKLWELIGRGGNFGFHGPTRSTVTLVKNFSALARIAPRRVYNLYEGLVDSRIRSFWGNK